MDRRLLRIHLSEQLALLTALSAAARRTRDQNRDSPFREPLEAVVRACALDRETLVEVMRALSLSRSRVKEAAAFAGERLGRLKLNGRLLHYSPLSRLMEITALQAGARLRQALWTDLEALSAAAPDLDGPKFAARARAAAEDVERLERPRVLAAELAFEG